MDKAQSTLSRGVVAPSQLPWTEEAQEILRVCVSAQPVLVQISVAKTLRDSTDRAAQMAQESEVCAERVRETALSLGFGSTSSTHAGQASVSKPTSTQRGVLA